MDIPALSMISAQTSTQSAADLLIMKQVMDSTAEDGQAMVDLLNTSAPRISPPHLGQSVDISA